MSDHRFDILNSRVLRLEKKMRNTRVAMLFGFGLFYAGIHHLAQMHHAKFKTFYLKHKSS